MRRVTATKNGKASLKACCDEQVVTEGRFAFGGLIHVTSFTIGKHLLLLFAMTALMHRSLSKMNCVSPNCECSWHVFFFGDAYADVLKPGFANCYLSVILVILSSCFTLNLAAFVNKMQKFVRANRAHDASKKRWKKVFIVNQLLFTLLVELLVLSFWLFQIGFIAVRRSHENSAVGVLLLTYLMLMIIAVTPICNFFLHIVFCFHVCECYVTNRDRKPKSKSDVAFYRSKNCFNAKADAPIQSDPSPMDPQRQRRVHAVSTAPKHPLPAHTLTLNTSRWIAQNATSPASVYAFDSPNTASQNNNLSPGPASPARRLFDAELSPKKIPAEKVHQVVSVTDPVDV